LLKFLFIEPFFGGSHKEFAEGLMAHSRHKFDLLTLPSRFWKWRMRGAALHFAEKIHSLADYAGIITSNLMSLSDFKMLTGSDCPPVLVYFHENQITYPLAPGEALDVQFGFTDITTGLAAQKILFNSHTHHNDFFSALPGFLRLMPEYRPHWVTETIQKKTDVCYPGCRFEGKRIPLQPPEPGPPIVVWNHRWEFDKNPDDFFAALDAVEKMGANFQLALLGENFQMVPKPFLAAKERYKDRIVQYGYAPSRTDYLNMLSRGAVVISTAQQENFGISIVEAVRHGCLPLLPKRLSYPEILPKEYHADFLYQNQTELVEKLFHLLSSHQQMQQTRQALSDAMGRYAWENVIEEYDEILEELINKEATS
jgi:glycosyltransferase involved in cell wall biosynthesis